jgi:hypothetical protein
MESVKSFTRYVQSCYIFIFLNKSNNPLSSMASRSRSRLSTSARTTKDEDDKYVPVSLLYLYSPYDLPFCLSCSVSAYDSGDDAMSVKSAKSTKSAMSVDNDNFTTTPPRRRYAVF